MKAGCSRLQTYTEKGEINIQGELDNLNKTEFYKQNSENKENNLVRHKTENTDKDKCH